MSLLNFLVEPDRLLLAFDTLCFESRTARYGEFVAKSLYAPQCGTLIAGRGNAMMVNLVHSLVSTSPAACFDEVVACVGAKLNDATAQLRKYSMIDSPVDDVALAGWSDRASSMVCVYYCRGRSEGCDWHWSEGESMDSGVGPDTFPGCEAISRADLATPEAMMALARRQVAHVRSSMDFAAGSFAAGGRLIVAEMTRRTLLYRDLGPIVAPLSAEDLGRLNIAPDTWGHVLRQPVPTPPVSPDGHDLEAIRPRRLICG